MSGVLVSNAGVTWRFRLMFDAGRGAAAPGPAGRPRGCGPRATAGELFRHLTTEDNPDAEPPAVMAEAALLLCRFGPGTLTGRITYSPDLLTELNVATPAR